LKGLGLAAGADTNAPSPTAPSGSVLSTNPVAGTQVSPGSAVSLEVSSGPAQVAADAAAQKRTPGRIQDFIFARELAEVYLLLDYLSGRSDKGLVAALGDGNEEVGKQRIKEICKIAWPPQGTSSEQAEQAAILMMAKDCLNNAARPANGASIAFTLLVAGEEKGARHKHGGSFSWSTRWPPWRSKKQRTAEAEGRGADSSPPKPAAPAGDAKQEAAEGNGGATRSSDAAKDSGLPPAGFWGGEAPSRFSLAKLAYPGLVGRARNFYWLSYFVMGSLFLWLIFTCLLSWDIAGGQAIMTRLDATDASIAAIEKRSPDLATRTKADTNEYDALQIVRRNSRQDLADWLAPWGWLKALSHKLCDPAGCQTEAAVKLLPNQINEQQWAAVLLQVLATAVLPLFYGLLGAGAAVVRSLWSKTRDSLLGRRDVLLSFGQMAQGAVIGACIGLFVTPSGTSQGVAAFTGAASLTPSALSFIAGFGVDSVFIALESLIKRIFNIPEQKP
jgi:PASTA domain